jgi:hypothetical protein
MRVIVRSSLNDGNFSKVKDYFKNMKENATSQFQNAQIENKNLNQWITELIDNPSTIWDTLQIYQEKLPSLGDIKPDLNENLSHEYTVRLIDAVLHKASKEANNE